MYNSYNLDNCIKKQSGFKIYLNSAINNIIIFSITICDSLHILGSYKNGNYY